MSGASLPVLIRVSEASEIERRVRDRYVFSGENLDLASKEIRPPCPAQHYRTTNLG